MEKPKDDFAVYSGYVVFPEASSPEEVSQWFDRVFSDWMSIPGIYTSSGLLKAINELSQRGWQFKLTLLPGEVPEGVPTIQRKLPNDSGIVHDVSAKGIGFADRKNPYFVGVSQDCLTLSYHERGLIKAFIPKEIFGLHAVLPSEKSNPLKE